MKTLIVSLVAALAFLSPLEAEAACGCSGRAGLFSGRLFSGRLFNRSRSSSSVVVRSRTVAVAEAVPVAPQAVQTQQTTPVRTFSRFTSSGCANGQCSFPPR